MDQSENPYRIRATVEVLHTPGAADLHRYHYQFLQYPGSVIFGGYELNVHQRFEEMASLLRARVLHENIVHVGLTFDPTEANAHSPRQRTFHGAGGITGDVLASIFEGMLQSQETLEIVGLRITLEDLGDGLRDGTRGGWGRGPAPGFRLVPPHLRGHGLGEHPMLARWKDDPAMQERLSKFCGWRALLLAHPDSCFRKDRVWEWIAMAERFALEMTEPPCPDGKLTYDRLPQMFADPEWQHLRIVVMGEHGHVEAAERGPNWRWPDGLPYNQEDPNSVHLLLDRNNHYWWIHSIQAFLSKVFRNLSRDRYPICYKCLTIQKLEQIEDHPCRDVGHHQCPVCLYVASSDEGLKSHFAQRNPNYRPCEICQRRVFYGAECHARHATANCRAKRKPGRNVDARRRICDGCHCAYLEGEPHECQHCGVCRNCEAQFSSPEDRSTHHCELVSRPRFWEPVRVRPANQRRKETTVWKSHWAYDFETTRAKELVSLARREQGLPEDPDAPKAYELAVMAWAVRLMVPDEETDRFVREDEVFSTVAREATYDPLRPSSMPDRMRGRIRVQFNPPLFDGCFPSVTLFGETIESFVWTVRNVLSYQDAAVSWEPTLWAHNGSKFDVKFVFDYYANVDMYEVSAPTYEKDQGALSVEPREEPDGRVAWKKVTHRMGRNRVINLVNIGSKILCLRADKATYKCSHAHHTTALRNLPAIFALPDDIVAKGEFPYALLKPENWDHVEERGLPPLRLYDVASMTAKRRKEVVRWWIEDQQRRFADRGYVLECLREAELAEEEIDTWLPGPDAWSDGDGQGPTPWFFGPELWNYLDNDVTVLALSMEAYHRLAALLHPRIWAELPEEDPRRANVDRVVSPLDCSTAPGWAYAVYTTWFMPPETIYTLRPEEHRFVRSSLRGGRTDKRCNFVEVTPERRARGDRMVYYDFKSLYPSVQKCSVHGTHFPVGVPWWINAKTPADRGGNWKHQVASNADLARCMGRDTGFLRVDARCLRYTTHPTLHVKARPDDAPEGDLDEKLLFRNADVRGQIYAWPELQEAIRCGEVEVTRVHEALLFRKGTRVFDEYVDFFFRLKDECEGTNEGMRSLAKLFLNSLWGKLGQRSYAVREWVSRLDRLDFLMNEMRSGRYEFVSAQKRDPRRTYIEYRIVDDVSNHESTAPHVAAYVSMWGRVVLHEKVLSRHGQRALYCDTDSAIIYLRAGDRVDYTGSAIGDLTDELPAIIKKAGYDVSLYPDLYIAELVAVAPKTYALTIKHDNPPLVDRSKVVCKGFEPTWNNLSAINYLSMKELVFTHHDLREQLSRKRPLSEEERTMAVRTHIRERGKFLFRSRLSINQPVPVEVTVAKALTGHYTKGRDHPADARLVVPYGAPPPSHETFLDFVDETRQYD